MIRMTLACVGMALACLATLAHAQSPPRPQDQDLCAQATAANVLVALTDAGRIDQTRVDPLHATARLLAHQMLGHGHERRIYRLRMEGKVRCQRPSAYCHRDCRQRSQP